MGWDWRDRERNTDKIHMKERGARPTDQASCGRTKALFPKRSALESLFPLLLAFLSTALKFLSHLCSGHIWLKMKHSRWDRVTEQQKSLREEQAQGDPLFVDHLERDEFDIIRKLPFPYSYCNFRPLCALKFGFKNLSQSRHKAQEL